MNKGRFKKGHKINLGRKASKETRIKISTFHKGKKWRLGHQNTPEQNKKIGEANSVALKGKKISGERKEKLILHLNKYRANRTGSKASPETKKKMSLASLGKEKPWLKGRKLHPDTVEKIRQRMLGNKFMEGKKMSAETRLKKSLLAKKGKDSPLWRGGSTKPNSKIRGSVEYKIWRTSVFERDNYTCQWCSARSCKGNPVVLNADHIKPFAYFPELRFTLSNGRTLCVSCHKKTPTYKSKKI